MWSDAVHWVHWLWGLLGDSGQGLPPPIFCSGPLSMSSKEICRWLLVVLGLDVPRQGQAEDQGWMLLVHDLKPLRRGTGLAKARCYLFERFRKT